ncbi:MAG: hypothetical protein JSU90_01480, partial [Nitrospiraceae bacterium]
MEIVRKVRETIGRYSMLSDGDHVLIGLSGGADSVCLAVILDKVREVFNLSLSALYVDHGLRPHETPQEHTFCEKLCAGMRVNFHARAV